VYATVAVTLGIFCIRPFALHCQQPEKDRQTQNVDFAPLWKNSCGRPWPWLPHLRPRSEEVTPSKATT